MCVVCFHSHRGSQRRAAPGQVLRYAALQLDHIMNELCLCLWLLLVMGAGCSHSLTRSQRCVSRWASSV